MKRSVIISLVILLFACFGSSSSAQQAPFKKGINLTSWFQAGNVRQIQFNRYSKKDFENIKSLGCDVIRLPINLHFMTSGSPGYTIDPLFYELLDQVVDWAEDLEMFLIIDNHTFDPAVNTDPGVGTILEKVWLQMASHYKNRSQYILYEILNEPHGIADNTWNTIQLNIINKIRSVDIRHTIVVGPANWNSYNNLASLPRYTDSNLLYTFHFYDPFLFTHQGSTWNTPSMATLANIPFPYRADSMPALPSSLVNTWVGDLYRNYPADGNVARVKQLIDIAVRFQADRKVPIFCGEFGVYIPNSKNHHRVYWYEVVRKYLEEKGIAWTSWDYHGGFGLFEKGSNGFFEHDLNVPLLEALGFTVPEQSDFSMKADSTGFPVYDDFPGPMIFESSWNEGKIDYYSKDKPNNGNYCLLWSGAKQYNTIGLDFLPDRDFSELVKKNYALDLFVRGDTPGLTFQIRFLDSKTESSSDYPWRMGILVTEQMAKWDRRWHHLHIKFSRMAEIGAWYNGWHNPQGLFDWKAIDRLEIVAENGALGNARFWFDNIYLTDQDTARINDTTAFTSGIGRERFENLFVESWPNPVRDFLNLRSDSPDDMVYQLFDSAGRALFRSTFIRNACIDMSLYPAGLYFIRVMDDRNREKVLKINKFSST